MARKTEFNHVRTRAGWMVSIPPKLSSTGKRERCYFKTRDAARDFAAGLKEKTKANGENASAIPPAMAEDAVLAAAVLAPWGCLCSKPHAWLRPSEKRKALPAP